MDRSKTMALTAQIYNKLSSVAFVAKTCSLHSSSLPLYLCLGCPDAGKVQPLCQHCFEQHQCEARSRGQVSEWVARQQEALSRGVMAAQKQYETVRASLQANKLGVRTRESQEGTTMAEANSQIVNSLAAKLAGNLKQIQVNYLAPAIAQGLNARMEQYLAQLRARLSTVGELSSVTQLCTQLQAQNQQLRADMKYSEAHIQAKCAELYRKAVTSAFEDVLADIFSAVAPDAGNTTEASLTSEALGLRVKEVEEQIARLRAKQADQVTQIIRLNEQLVSVCKQHRLGQKQTEAQIQALKNSQKQLQGRISLLQQKIAASSMLQSQCQQAESKITILTLKNTELQDQLSSITRTSANLNGQVQGRYNLEEAANQLAELSDKYKNLLLQSADKDRRIVELIMESNKKQLKVREARSPPGSAYKDRSARKQSGEFRL